MRQSTLVRQMLKAESSKREARSRNGMGIPKVKLFGTQREDFPFPKYNSGQKSERTNKKQNILLPVNLKQTQHDYTQYQKGNNGKNDFSATL